MYFRLRDGEISHTAPLGEPDLGATVDLDAEGNVLGVESLSFEDFAEMMEGAHGILELPENMSSGVLGGMSDSPSSGETAARRRLRRNRTPRVG